MAAASKAENQATKSQDKVPEAADSAQRAVSAASKKNTATEAPVTASKTESQTPGQATNSKDKVPGQVADSAPGGISSKAANKGSIFSTLKGKKEMVEAKSETQETSLNSTDVQSSVCSPITFPLFIMFSQNFCPL